MKDYKHDFSWGDTRGIREIMVKECHKIGIFGSIPWHGFGYPPHEGDGKLIGFTRQLIKDLTGTTYKHVLITAGATHAINAYIFAVKNQDTHFVFTNHLYFSFYPGIAANHKLIHVPVPQGSKPMSRDGQVGIIDSPSNPEGLMHNNPTGHKGIIWDAAYYSPTYCGIGTKESLKCHPIIPQHEAVAGSFNKLTGINGLRIGWLATNDDNIAQKALQYVESDLCGVSYPSQYVALQIVKYVDLEAFYGESKDLLDANRAEIARLSDLFGHQQIPVRGMFALFVVDEKLKKLLDKAAVKVMEGSTCGDSRDSVRFNLANSNRSTKEMVDAILKADFIKK